MLQRAFPVLIVLALVLGSISCGGGGGTSSTTTPPVTTTTSGSTNPTPVITDLQDAGTSGSSLILRVTGTGFIASSSVHWNGASMATTFVSSTTLTFAITVADVPPSGTVQMNVVNPPPGGGTSNTVTIQFSTVQPILTTIAPSEAVQGDLGFTLQLTGNSFFPNSVVKWNGVALPTTYISGTQLSAQVNSTRLMQAGTFQVSVFTDGPANGATSSSMPFVVRQHYATLGNTISLRTNDLKFDSAKNRLYASAPSIAGSTYGNSIVEIDTSSVPAIASSAFVGSEPGKLALSSDGSTLFVELRGAAALRKYDTNTHSPGLQFTLGPDPQYGTYYVGDMEVVPGSNTALAVSRMTPNISPGFAGVAVYDDGVKRPNETPRYFAPAADRIEFGASPSTLFGFDVNANTLSTIQVDANGVTNIDNTPNLFPGLDFKWDAGRLYSTSGWVVDPNNKTVLGGFNLGGLQVFKVLPDTANNRVYFIGQNAVGKVIASYNATTFAMLDSVGLPAFDGEFASAAYLGSGKFAIASDHGTIYFVNATPAPGTVNLPALTSISPNWAVQGSSPFTLQVTGNSFLAGSVVKWNGAPLSTTFVSSTRLDAQIGATELAMAGTAQVTAFNPGPGNGATSAAAPFTVVEHNATVTNTVTLRADALQFNGATNRLYASVPGSAGSTYGNSVVEIDTTGAPAIATSTFIGSEPGTMALSQDGSTLYVALRGAAAVRKYDTASHSPGLQFSLGSEQDFGLFYVDDMAVVPGTTSALAVSRKVFTGGSGHAGVAIYDDGIPRANTTASTAGHIGANRIEFGAASDTIFGMSTESYGYFKIQIDNNGAQVVDSASSFAGHDMKWDSGRLYSTSGQVFDPLAKAIIGTIPLTDLSISAVAPDVANQRVYFVGRDDTGKWIKIYDPSHLTPSDTLVIPGFAGEITDVAYLGGGNFAIASDAGTIYFVSATPSSSQTILPSISSLFPNQAFQGVSFGSLQVLGARFLPNSVVKWNGVPLRTSYDRSSRIFADVTNTLLAQAGTAQITVFTDGPGGGATSNSVPLPILAPPSPLPITTLSLFVDSMVYDPTRQTLFASTPSGTNSGNSLVEIDVSGTPFIARTTFVGNEPGPLAISDDASTLFVGPRRANAVVKYDIASHALGAQFALGSDPFFGAYSPLYIAVLPGSTSSIAVARRDSGSAGAAIYDEATGKRGNETSRSLTGPLAFCAPSPYLFLLNGDLSRITVDAAGATIFDSTERTVSGRDFRCSNGRLYGGAFSNPPTVADAVTLTLVGAYAPGPFTGLSSIFNVFAVLPDASGITYILGDGNNEKVVYTYSRDTFVFLKKTSLTGIPSTPRLVAAENLGNGRIAIATDDGKLYFVTIP